MLGIFIRYPWIAMAIGAVFFAVGFSRRRRAALSVGVLWLLYAAYETGMRMRWLCTGECNIRVDLLLIYPVLLVASIIAIWSASR